MRAIPCFAPSSLDTGGIVNRDINGVRDAIVWNNDRLVIAMDSNATRFTMIGGSQAGFHIREHAGFVCRECSS